jgi:crotonobetainyl-CoA:carnitine CoA-transferase CaiB-like acyl-CoA transferase
VEPSSAGPLDGVRVVELGVVIAGPATAAILADWGADVVKLEPIEGDPQRGNLEPAYFRLDNRGKRSVSLDLKREAGREIVLALLERADVFVSNLRPSALARLGLDWATLSERYPRLVYATITGYGRGPEADRPGYDMGAFWSRMGNALALTPRGGEPPFQRPGMGDHTTALSAAAGICAALLAQARTGQGQLVETSLLRTGAYFLGSDLAVLARGGNPGTSARRMMGNPLLGAYQAGDSRWLWLLGVQSGRHWPSVARAIGRDDLVEDPRYADPVQLVANRREAMALLDEAFAARPLEDWAAVFEREDVWFERVQSPGEALEDPGVLAAGVLRDTEDGERTVATPVDFSTVTPRPAPPAPEAGQHTEEVLLELGRTWDDLLTLKENGVIP